MKCITRRPDNSLVLNVYVQPRASKNRIAGMHGNALKVCITAPPVDNKGNKAVVDFVANLFGVSRAAVSITGGRQGRNKKVQIINLSLAEARQTLAEALSEN